MDNPPRRWDRLSRNWRLVFVVLAAVALVGVGILVGTRTSATAGHQAGHTQLVTAAALGPREFIDMMIPHHEMAIEMARIAEKGARDPNVRALASEIALFQSAEIDRMKQWRRLWYGADDGEVRLPAVEQAAMGMAVDMDAYRTTEKIDEAFLAAMIPHHAGALVMAQRALATPGQRPQIRRLATTILDAQAQEIALMNRMLRSFATFGRAQP